MFSGCNMITIVLPDLCWYNEVKGTKQCCSVVCCEGKCTVSQAHALENKKVKPNEATLMQCFSNNHPAQTSNQQSICENNVILLIKLRCSQFHLYLHLMDAASCYQNTDKICISFIRRVPFYIFYSFEQIAHINLITGNNSKEPCIFYQWKWFSNTHLRLFNWVWKNYTTVPIIGLKYTCTGRLPKSPFSIRYW